MSAPHAQPETYRRRADARLDAATVKGLGFFAGQNRTKKHRAAILLAEDDLTDEAIVAKLKISRSTLSEWKLQPEFQQVVGDYRGRIIGEALKLPIAKKHQRVAELNDLNERYHRIIAERAERHAAAMQAADTEDFDTDGEARPVPAEALTGLMVQQHKISASGKTVTEWAFDRALDSAIKETHKQAAQELGQWEETLNVNHGGTVAQEYVIVEDVPWEALPEDEA